MSNTTLQAYIEMLYEISVQLEEAANAPRNYNTLAGEELEHHALDLRRTASQMKQIWGI